MFNASWLRRLFALKTRSHRPCLARPELEGLEDRTVPSLAATPWPTLGQNVQHSGVGPSVGAQTGHLDWTTSVTAETSGIAIGADGLYASMHGPVKVGFDGQVLWRDTTTGTAGVPAVDANGTVYFTCYWGTSWNVRAYTFASDGTGTLKWVSPTWDNGGAWTQVSPVIGLDGSVLEACQDGYLRALSPDTGQLRWAYKTRGMLEGSAAVAADGTIYAGSDDKNLYALNPNGSLKWKLGARGPVYNTPTVGGGGTIYVQTDGPGGTDDLISVSPSGRQNWRVSSQLTRWQGAEVAVDDVRGNLYVSGPTGLSSFKLDGTFRWNVAAGDRLSDHPAIGVDGTVYFESYDGHFHAVTPDGRQLFDVNLPASNNPDAQSSDPAINSDGTVYIGGWGLHAFKDVTAPLVVNPQIGSFTASADAVTSGGSETLTAANISDGTAGASITQVAFYAQVNGATTLLGYGTPTGTGAWSFTFTVGLTPGTYTLFAQAQDSAGLFSDPVALTLQVN
jgi:outer membrane protein assembly factor BamB